MGLLRLLVSAPQLVLLLVVPLLYSVIAHEVAHGWCAGLFGDDTAKRAGRLTLNPLRCTICLWPSPRSLGQLHVERVGGRTAQQKVGSWVKWDFQSYSSSS